RSGARSCRGRSAVVAAAAEHAAPLAREQLFEVLPRDRVELEVELGGQLADVPEHIAELARERRLALGRDAGAVVADDLLDVLGDLAGLTGQPERGVDQPGIPRILRRAARAPLIFRELHARKPICCARR